MKETILVNNKSEEIEVGPISLLFHQGDVNIKIPTRFEISAFDTIEATNNITEEQWNYIVSKATAFHISWDLIFQKDILLPQTITELRNQGTGVKHVCGLIFLTFKALSQKKQPFYKFPESFLHPKYQANLVEFFLFIQDPPKFIERNLC